LTFYSFPIYLEFATPPAHSALVGIFCCTEPFRIASASCSERRSKSPQRRHVVAKVTKLANSLVCVLLWVGFLMVVRKIDEKNTLLKRFFSFFRIPSKHLRPKRGFLKLVVYIEKTFRPRR
jgi:hypothetical protein